MMFNNRLPSSLDGNRALFNPLCPPQQMGKWDICLKRAFYRTEMNGEYTAIASTAATKLTKKYVLRAFC